MPELVWDGKYGADGSKTRPVRVALPFQDVETVNESAQERSLMLDLFARNEPGEWRNRLIWGDKKYALPSLLPEFAGKVNLIYIDPPFATGADFSYTAKISDDPTTDGDQSATFVKQPSIIEQKAYRDTWGRGLDSYLQWFYETAILLHELLAEDGSIYVHLDQNVSHYAKAILDEVFGKDRFVNEVIWQKLRASKAQSIKYGNVHDNILLYSKTERYKFIAQFLPYPKKYQDSHYGLVEKGTGRRYGLWDFTQAGRGEPRRFDDRILAPPPGKHWIWSQDRIDKGMAENRIIFTSSGMPRVKRYLDEARGNTIEDIWVDIYDVNSQANERLGYPTQKPENLLERIIKASSSEDDLVLDCFAGSGTTAAVAEKLGRRWIVADLGRFAIHTTRKRLLSNPDVRPFVVQNLGKYERQAWQTAEFGESDQKAALAQARYRRFVLDLYGAEPIEGYTWLHGVRAGHFVHIGSVDAPVLAGDVKAIAREFWKAAGRGSEATGAATNAVDILG